MITRIQKIIESCKTRCQVNIAMTYIILAKKKELINDSDMHLLMELIMEKIESLNKI